MSRSGLASQLGLAAESTWGTAVTVSTFVPLVSETMGTTIPWLESNAMLAGRNVMTADQQCQGNREVGGDLQLELPTNSTIIRLLLEQMFGSVSGTGPWTFTPGDLWGKSFSAQVGVPGVDGTVRAKTYDGCKVSSWEIAATAGELVTLGLSIIAEDETTATALASASYGAGAAIPFCFAGATATVAASAVNVRSLTLAGDNALTRRNFLGSRLTAQPIGAGKREYTGTLDLEFVDLTAYNRFVNGTTAAVVLTFVGPGTSQLVVTMNCRFDGQTPQVSGAEIVGQPLPFKAVASTTDASAITAVYTA